jgi:hypothetical protein
MMSVLGKDTRCWVLAAIICLAGLIPALTSEQFCRTKSQNRVRTARVIRLDDHDHDHSLDGAALALETAGHSWMDEPAPGISGSLVALHPPFTPATAVHVSERPGYPGSRSRGSLHLRAPPVVLS